MHGPGWCEPDGGRGARKNGPMLIEVFDDPHIILLREGCGWFSGFVVRPGGRGARKNGPMIIEVFDDPHIILLREGLNEIEMFFIIQKLQFETNESHLATTCDNSWEPYAIRYHKKKSEVVHQKLNYQGKQLQKIS